MSVVVEGETWTATFEQEAAEFKPGHQLHGTLRRIPGLVATAIVL